MTIRIAPRRGGVPDDGGAPLIPTSKSHAQRALCLGAFLPDSFEWDQLPKSRDVQVLLGALRAAPGEVRRLHDNGTAMRFLSVVMPMAGESCVLDGGTRLRNRPLQASMDFLRRYGASCSTDWPRCFDGTGVEWPDDLEVDARLTTQTATGVLLGAALRLARFEQRHCVRIIGPSAPNYLLITMEVLAWFGFHAPYWWEDGDLVVDMEKWDRRPDGHIITIPTDASSHTFYAALRAMHGLEPDTPPHVADIHPDWLFVEDLERLLQAPANQPLEFTELARRPDTFPCLAAVAALRCGRTTFRNIPSLRLKESDRIRAMARALETLGVRCTEHSHGMVVEGPMPAHANPVQLPSPDDHRVVMALALLGTRVPGGVELQNPAAVAKSWPGFFDWLERVSDVTWL